MTSSEGNVTSTPEPETIELQTMQPSPDGFRSAAGARRRTAILVAAAALALLALVIYSGIHSRAVAEARSGPAVRHYCVGPDDTSAQGRCGGGPLSTNLGLRLAGLLTLMTGFGLAAIATSSAATHTGFMWPVGLAAGTLVVASRRQAPYLVWVIALLAAGTFLLGGYPTWVSIGYGLGIAIEAFVAERVLTAGTARRLLLLDTNDLGTLRSRLRIRPGSPSSPKAKGRLMILATIRQFLQAEDAATAAEYAVLLALILLVLLPAHLMHRRATRRHGDIHDRRPHSRRDRLHRVIQRNQRRHTVVIHRRRRRDHRRMNANAAVMKGKRSCQHQRKSSPHGSANPSRLTY